MSNEIVKYGNWSVIRIRENKDFYNVIGNDALIFNKYFGYKLYGAKVPRTGFPKGGLNKIIGKLDDLSIDYDVINGDGMITVSRRFETNKYEVIEDTAKKPIVNKNSRINDYKSVLVGLSEGVNVITGEIIVGIDFQMKSKLCEIADYLSNRSKLEEKKKTFPNQGAPWSIDEDEQLFREFRNGLSVKEISRIHGRSSGAIESRLDKIK